MYFVEVLDLILGKQIGIGTHFYLKYFTIPGGNRHKAPRDGHANCSLCNSSRDIQVYYA